MRWPQFIWTTPSACPTQNISSSPLAITAIPVADSFRYASHSTAPWQNLEQKRIFQIGATAFSIGILIFAILDRQNQHYYDNIFIDAEISANGEIILNCKPGFADSRTFVVKTESKELEDQIKEFGEFYQGSYFLQNTRISKNFRFTELKSITIKQFGDNELKNHFTWTKEELNGSTEFLKPWNRLKIKPAGKNVYKK